MVTAASPIGLFPTSFEEDIDMDMDSLRSRRRRTTSTQKKPSLCRSQSLGCEIGHAATETYLITRLAFTLLRYLGLVQFISLIFWF